MGCGGGCGQIDDDGRRGPVDGAKGFLLSWGGIGLVFSNARRRLRQDHGAGGLEVATRTRRTCEDVFIYLSRHGITMDRKCGVNEEGSWRALL